MARYEPPKKHPDSQEYRDIYLGYGHSSKIHLSLDGWRQFLELIDQQKMCTECDRLYSSDRPNVAGTTCMECFKKKYPSYTFQGQLPDAYWQLTNSISKHMEYEAPVYYWLHRKTHHIYWTQAGFLCSQTPYTAGNMTLKYWNFPMPAQYKDTKGKVWDVSKTGTWHICGDPEWDVVIATYGDAAFFLYKHQNTLLHNYLDNSIQVTWRRQDHKTVRDAAKKMIEMRKKNGHYQIYNSDNGEITKEYSWVPDGEIYRMMAWIMDRTIARIKENQG